jgi:thiol-disulfide isomerase/thioredoxin
MTAASKQPRTVLVVGAVAVLFGIWAGMRVYSSRAALHRAGDGGASAMRVPVGEASPPTGSDFDASFDPAAPTPAKIPERLPDFSLSDATGKLTSIEKWAGKSLILNFWATWCAPCRREIPLLKALNSEWHGRDVAVVGIAVDYPDKVIAYANDLKIAYPLLIGDEDALDVATQLGVGTPVFPFTVFTDRRGDVVALYLGELHRAQADLILGVVQSLNEERVDLTAARRTIAAGLSALAGHAAG